MLSAYRCISIFLGMFGIIAGVSCQTAAARPLVSDWVTGHKTKARLLAGELNGRSMAFVEIALEPKWKTYWRNPGDAGGLPPTFNWQGSKNLAETTVKYPAPIRFREKTGDTIGYKGTVIFPIEIGAADNSKPITLALDLNYGICLNICVPVNAQLALAVPAGPLPAADPMAADALAMVPRKQSVLNPGDPKFERLTENGSGKAPTLEIEATFPRGGKSAEIYLHEASGAFVPHPKKAKDLGDGRLLFVARFQNQEEFAALRGKLLTITIVGASGASEATYELAQ